LQERELERVGGNRTIKVDVRVLATTNRRLEESVERKEFRQDLYFRLNVVPIHVPPLREHKEDVPFLARQFMPRFARKHGVRVRGFSDSCLAALQAHRWPGNVRELQNVIERAVILCGDVGVLEPEHLGFSAPPAALMPPLHVSDSAAPAAAPSPPAESANLSLAEWEKRHILAIMEKNPSRTQAARLLGISIRTLRNKLNEYGVNNKDDESGDTAETGPAEQGS
jgi:DNA-binding NtrC family response regulator